MLIWCWRYNRGYRSLTLSRTRTTLHVLLFVSSCAIFVQSDFEKNSTVGYYAGSTSSLFHAISNIDRNRGLKVPAQKSATLNRRDWKVEDGGSGWLALIHSYNSCIRERINGKSPSSALSDGESEWQADKRFIVFWILSDTRESNIRTLYRYTYKIIKLITL